MEIEAPISYNVQKYRADFPILTRKVGEKPLVYFDNAATTQKPTQVVEALLNYYRVYNANIHRGIHSLAEQATAAYEATRDAVKQFTGAQYREEIIFTRGVTEGINLVAHSLGRMILKPDDEILISTMEHHSNIVPWQLIAEITGAKLKVIPINTSGEIIWEKYLELLNPKVKVVSVVHVSNALGTINPVKEIVAAAHDIGALTLVDGAQAASHLEIDVQNIDTDFYVFSAHKLYGPTGVGVLYGKKKWLEAMPPYQGGGEMIQEVTFNKTTYNELPYKFEAGTPNIADTVALKAALDYIHQIGKQNIAQWEDELLQYATDALSSIPGIKIIGTAKQKISVVSFIMEGTHPQDLGIILDSEGIAIRTGHHCTQPLMQHLGIMGTARASFALYNTIEEIDVMIKALYKAKKMLL